MVQDSRLHQCIVALPIYQQILARRKKAETGKRKNPGNTTRGEAQRLNPGRIGV